MIRDHGSDVPKELDALLKLRGVGPKIAMLALSACWGIDQGFVFQWLICPLVFNLKQELAAMFMSLEFPSDSHGHQEDLKQRTMPKLSEKHSKNGFPNRCGDQSIIHW